tara:strand:- start:354 stop:719 length:366 start_codon:yes stop_codon:yes gene_type:complete
LSDNPGHTKGNITIHHAISRLLEEGYNVYQNTEYHGQFDLIIESRRTRKLLRVDVKSLNYIDNTKTRMSGATLRTNQRDFPEDGILFLIVDADGCMWIQGHISQSTSREDRLKESMDKLGM